MANLRDLKKEIDYRLEEFVFDCEMAISSLLRRRML